MLALVVACVGVDELEFAGLGPADAEHQEVHGGQLGDGGRLGLVHVDDLRLDLVAGVGLDVALGLGSLPVGLDQATLVGVVPAIDAAGVRWLRENEPGYFRLLATALTENPAKPNVSLEFRTGQLDLPAKDREDAP